MPDLICCVATMKPDCGVDKSWLPWSWNAKLAVHNNAERNIGVVASYQKLYERTKEPILAYVHDDVRISDTDWTARVLEEFSDPSVGVVGFGGALIHGSDDLYLKPYRIEQLARRGYRSNTDDAEAHGERFSGSTDVAVLDGFALIVRRELLMRCGGWHPEKWPPHHLYDYVICAQTHRYGYRCRMVGVRCQHLGGRTATSKAYLEWVATTEWGSDEAMHAEGHRRFYNEFRDVLPSRCV